MASTTTFEYAVRDRTGKMTTGRIEAESPAQVASKLKSMGYAPLKISQVETKGLKMEISVPGFGPKVKLKDIAVFARQFATMINSGLSLLRALNIAEEQTPNKLLAEVLGEVRADVEAGADLSGAMSKHPKIFPPLMVNMT